MDRTILHLDMNAFFASVEQRDNPALRGRPVFVCGNRHSRTVVATASYEARPFGVTTGMPRGEALRLCPQAVLVEGNPAKYVDTFRRVARLMERYGPDLEVMSIDEAFLDVTLTAGRFGGPVAIARELQTAVRDRFGLPCSVGVAANKLLAKLASGLKKPNGITRIEPDQAEALLADLRVEELCGIGRALQAALNADGITTCGELARVAPERLVRRFGRHAGLRLARMARGIDDDPVVPVDRTPAAKSMGHMHTLSRDTDDPARMRAVLLDLSEKIGRRLRAERASGRTVTLTVRLKDFNSLVRAETFDRFLDHGFDIYRAACAILEALDPAQPVRLLGISVSGLAYGQRQGWWLPEVAREERLSAACDQLNDRFGERTIGRAAVAAEPEAGGHYQLKRYAGRNVLG